MLLSIRSLFAEIPNFHFEQIPTLSALPNNEILTLLQDSDGFIWIATKGGLYKYDGYNIKEYRSNLYNPELLSDNWVSALAEDNNKRLYIGTKDGLNILDKQKIDAYNKHKRNVFQQFYDVRFNVESIFPQNQINKFNSR